MTENEKRVRYWTESVAWWQRMVVEDPGHYEKDLASARAFLAKAQDEAKVKV